MSPRAALPRRAGSVLAAVLAALVLAALVPGVASAQTAGRPTTQPTASASGAVRTSDHTIDVRGGPGVPGTVPLDTTLYLPQRTPAPAVLIAHGFGGDKRSSDADARAFAARGYVVLAWTARGFGASGGQIALDSPDYEVADAQQLVDWLAARPEVQLDAPGDPRVGVTGGSYGGALSLLLAGYDKRIDAIAPVITWNDLNQALFPDAGHLATDGPLPVDTPARTAFGQDGVFKRGWAGLFFGSGGLPTPTGTPPAPTTAAPGDPLTCGRFTAAVCAAYTEAATTGRLSPATHALLLRSSPASVTDRITAPTLLLQGEQDTLFGLDQADATARQLAAHGTTVKVAWYAGGHDGGLPGAPEQALITSWFDFHLRGTGPDPGTTFQYTVDSGVRAAGNTPTTRTVVAPAYPGLGGSAPLQPRPVPLQGQSQEIVSPAGGNPAALTSIPGVSGLLGSLGGRLTSLTGDISGQTAHFTTAPFGTQTDVAGSPRIDLTVAAVPGQPTTGTAVLFGKVFELAPDGSRTLLGGSVAPTRVTVPADGTPVRLTLTLPAVVAPIEAGHTLSVAVGTTDQAYTSPTVPAVWRITPADGAGLALPVVAGQVVTAGSVPVWPLVGIGIVLALALAAWLVARVLRARRRVPDEPAADARPLEITGLAKTYEGGFQAVKDVSFTVEPGMVLGLLGPNGAGKTTVLRMLMGLIAPTAGTIRAFGRPIAPGAPVLARIGAFVEGPGFLPHLSGADNLRLYWAATGRPTAEARLEEALEIAGLGESVHRRVGTYSQGMRQRLAIAQAMLGLPELLVLDEPTNGLDPPQIHAMRELLWRYAEGGRTVLVSSHLLAEVEQTCSHVVVMHHGKVVASGTVDELIAGGGAASFGVDEPDRAVAVLAALDGVRDVATDGGLVHAELNGTPRASAVEALVAAGIAVESAGPRRRLEDAFLQLVGEDTQP